MYLIEITAAVDAPGNTQKFYVSNDNFVTKPTDTPANTAFDPLLLNPGSIGGYAYSDGRTGGSTKLEIGEIILANIDGQIDSWIDYSFDGRELKIYKGERDSAYPSGFSVVFTGTMEAIEASFDKVVIRIRDKSYLFDVPVSTNLYLGNNTLPNGIEGTDDIKGKRKPQVFGNVSNITPELVNTSKLIYQFHDNTAAWAASVSNVYDRGLALTAGADYTSQSDMENNAPAAGYYRRWSSGGCFRLGSSPGGQITCDAFSSGSWGVEAAYILYSLAMLSGITEDEISFADTVELANIGAAVGIFCQEESILEAMDAVALSIGAWYGFDGDGILRMGQLTSPESSIVDFYDYDLLEGIDRKVQKDIAIPIWRVNIDYKKNYTVQDSDIAGAVSIDRRAFLSSEYRTESVENNNKTKWKLSQEYNVKSLLYSNTDAANEAARLLALYEEKRDIFEITLSIDDFDGLNLLDTVTLYLDRFGMEYGRMFRIIGTYHQLDTDKITVTLWG